MNDKARTSKLWGVVFFLSVATLVGCTQWRVAYGTRPVDVRMRSIHTVAVLKFEGPYGESVQRHISSRLDEVHYFSPIDIPHGQGLDEAVYDQADNPMRLSTLEALGADAVVTGRVSARIDDIAGTDQVHVKEGTGYYKKEKNVFGHWVDVEIKRTVVKAIPYIIRQASIDTEYKMFDLKTRRAITTGRLTEAFNKKFGGDKESGSPGHKLSDLPPPNHTADELAASVAIKLVARFSRMKLASAAKLDEGGNTMVKRGVALAGHGAWKEAVQLWEQVISEEPGNASAYYNLAVAYETLGDMKSLNMASLLYNRAASYEDKKLYTEAVARIEGALRGMPNQ